MRIFLLSILERLNDTNKLIEIEKTIPSTVNNVCSTAGIAAYTCNGQRYCNSHRNNYAEYQLSHFVMFLPHLKIIPFLCFNCSSTMRFASTHSTETGFFTLTAAPVNLFPSFVRTTNPLSFVILVAMAPITR